MKHRLLLIGAGIPAAIVCLLVLTMLFIPNRAIEGVVARALASQGYTLHCKSFGLAFPIGVKGTQIEIASEKGPVIRFDRLTARLRILPLFTGKAAVGYHGAIGNGTIDGEYGVSGKGNLKLEIEGVKLEDIPFFPTVAGAQVKGELRASGNVSGKRMQSATGELKLAVKNAQFQGVKLGDMPLPDATYKTVQGMLRIGKGRATLESLTFDGEGLYTRLKGDMPLMTPLSASPLNLTLELMPRPEFLEKQKFIFLLLTKYQTSPGHYQMPVRGTLGKPSAM